MRKYLLLVALILLALVVAACATSVPAAPTPAPTAVPVPATLAAEEAAVASPDYVGTFTASLPAADSPGRIVTAALAEDGSVQVTSDYQNGQPPIVETGTWQANADGSLSVSLTEQDGQAYFEPQVFQVTLDAATGELMVAGAEGNLVRMARGTAEPAPEAVEPPATEEAGAAAANYVGTYALAGPDGGVLTFVLADDSALRASIDYPDGTPSTVISGTWQANADGSVTATLTEQDGQTFPPQDIPLMLDTATDELVLAAADGNELRLARAGDEAAAVPAETTPMTPTVTVTATEAMTPTAPMTATEAVTATAAMTATEAMTPTVAMTTTKGMTATVAVTGTGTLTPTATLVAGNLKNTYIATLPAASGGGERLIALNLHDDGTARMVTDFHYQSDDPPVVEIGAWQDNGDGTLTVTLTGQEDKTYDKPVVITFKQDGDLLEMVEYDLALYGSEGMTLRRADDVVESLNTSLITIDLQAGFPLDPTFVSVNAGGQVDASLLSSDCNGFINSQPVVTVNWTGSAPLVKAFFVSDDDPTMVISTPDGQILCNDDANDQLLDPRIQIDNPITGTYKIWLGGYSRNQLIPGVLVLTTKEDVTLATFNLGAFIKRPALPEVDVEPTPVASPSVTGTTSLKTALPELTAEAPITRSLVASGTVPVFQLGVEDPACSGLVTIIPDFVFQWSGEANQVRVFYEGDGDATLLVASDAEDKAVACADETDAGNRNPLVVLDTPSNGVYGVWVGRLDPSKPISGVLTVTTEADATPTIFKPAPQPAGGAGLANPASVFCEEQGGKVDIRTATDGSQSGFCIFPDGSECDEWAFFRGQCKPGQTK